LVANFFNLTYFTFVTEKHACFIKEFVINDGIRVIYDLANLANVNSKTYQDLLAELSKQGLLLFVGSSTFDGIFFFLNVFFSFCFFVYSCSEAPCVASNVQRRFKIANANCLFVTLPG